MKNKEVKSWESLSIEDKRAVAKKRFDYYENEHCKIIRDYLNTPRETLDKLTKIQEEMNRQWNSLDFQASEAMERVNIDYYYTHIEKNNLKYHTAKLINEIISDEDDEGVNKEVQRIIYKCQRPNANIVQLLTDSIYGIENSIIDDYGFGCDWVDAGSPDISDVGKLSVWHNSEGFKDFLVLLVMRNKLKEYREKIQYPECELRLITHAEKKRAEIEKTRIKSVNASIKNWVYNSLAGNIDRKIIIDIWGIIEVLLTEKKIPDIIVPISEIKDLSGSDLSSFIWVVWSLQRDTAKVPIEEMVTFIRELFPVAFTHKGKLNKHYTIQQHLKDDKGRIIKIPEEYKNY